MKPISEFLISVNIVILILAFSACSEGKTPPTGDAQNDGTGDQVTEGQDIETDDELTPCIPSAETCNGRDDDCDGEIDNGFDLLFDASNCGACGWVCELDHATAMCENGACWVDTCDEGYYDANDDPSDGCEYTCTLESTNESVEDGTCSDGIDNDCDGRIDENDGDCSDCVPEFCDALDNDCDGLVDEDFDLRSDTNHCGNCSTVCPDYPHAIGFCVLGSCNINCEAGFSDLDGIIINGCEATCEPDADPNESPCDGIDNDCDGFRDEDYVPFTCGVGACMSNSVCWDGSETCEAADPPSTADTVCNAADDDCDGSVDEDYVPTDACTGYCRTTATCVEGDEICGSPLSGDATCDGVDDDCDGVADDDYVSYTCGSGSCTRQSTCIGGTENCDSGAPMPEICNGSDDNCDGSIDNGDIAALCSTTPPNGTAACEDGLCVIDHCSSGYFDIDGTYINGCECAQESTESTSTACGSAHNLGSFPDDGTRRTISGNIVPSGDSDWYTFTAPDSSDSSCDTYHVDVRFTSNPGSVFRMDVYRGSCSDTDPCLNESSAYDWYSDYSSGGKGECPCNNGAVNGVNVCQDRSSAFFVRIFRASGTTVTCDSYTIEVSNSYY
jgi:hypothetical protein